MFLLCCVTDLPRVIKRKDGDSVEFCNNVLCDKCTIIPSDERFIETITCKILQNRRCQWTETCKMDFWYVLFIYLTSPN